MAQRGIRENTLNGLELTDRDLELIVGGADPKPSSTPPPDSGLAKNMSATSAAAKDAISGDYTPSPASDSEKAEDQKRDQYIDQFKGFNK